jgi:hypothetical protein
MRLKNWKTGILLTLLLLVLITPATLAGNYDRTYTTQTQFGLTNRQLYVSVPSSLYDYYHGNTIKLTNDDQYATLVTPDAVKPIADILRNLTNNNPRNDEQFANAVLTLIHQIPYNTSDIKYPIESIVENQGKCDTLSLLAASIMKAGGLDTVLLYFKDVHHMNVGIYLPYTPHTTWWWLTPTGYELNNKTYWIAECTPAMNWKVGDVPPILTDEKPYIISLENSETTSPAHVSAKLGKALNASSITINLSPTPSDINAPERTLTISGSITPPYPNETVTVYISQDGITYTAGKTETDNQGNYIYNWNSTTTGTYYIRTSWSGNTNSTGADSDILTVFLGFPQSLIQFQGPGYYYTYGRAYAARYELRVRQGVEDFLNIQLLGTGVQLTGEFTTVKSGQLITISKDPETQETLETVTIPKGAQPLRLPDDIERSTNDQFCFILQNSGQNNYSLNVKALDDYDIAKINPHGTEGTAFMNTSGCIKENEWYNIVAKISENEITAELQDTNGTVLEHLTTTNAANVKELVILLANNTDRAVAFKNLNVKTLNQPADPAEGDKKAATGNELLAPNAAITILLATVFAAVVYMKKRKRTYAPALNGNRKR